MSSSSDWNVPGAGTEIYETVFVRAMMGAWAARAIALAHPQADERVLDVGCGTGVLTRLLAQVVGPEGRLVGLDLNPEMLAVARQVPLGSEATKPIEWQEGSATALPFQDEAFDVVFCEFGLMLFSDRSGALQEMHRVLVRDGRLAITVWGSIHNCPGQMAMKQTWEPHFGADAAGIFRRQHSLHDAATLLSLLHEAGFRDAHARTVMGAVRFPSAEHLVRGYGAMLGTQADDATRSIVIDEVSAALRPYAGTKGVEYPIEAILASARR